MRWIKQLTTFFRKKTKRVLVLCCLFIPTLIFAAGLPWEEALLKEAATIDLLQKIIAVASWIWVIPASFAWKFMTNYFIYGDSFYLANYLFKFWQIIRTFAYFALGFYFLGSILYIRFNDKEAKSWMADLIKNTIIAWFLIGWSRWMIAAAVDLSIVFTSAVASIPSQIYAQNRTVKKQQCFSIPKKIDVKSDLTVDPVLLSEKANRKPITWAEIAPDGSNVAWPLTFFGSSVLSFFDMVFLPEWSSEANANRINSAAFIIVAVKAIMAIMLIVPLFILVIVNIIRVVYLRIRIVFSPFIVLMNVFDVKISDWLQKYIDWKNILGLILQPVAVIGMLSVWLILVIELTSIFNLCVSQKQGDPLQDGSLSATIKQGDVVPIWDGLFDVTLTASLSQLWDTLWWVAGELILAWFVVILLWSLLKVWFSFSELTAWLAKNITDSTEDIVWALPIIGLPWSSGAVWIWTLNKMAKEWFWLDRAINNIKSKQQDDIMDRLKLGDWTVKIQEIWKLKELAQKSNTKLEDLQKEITAKLKTWKINATDAKDIVKTWLSNNAKILTPENRKILNSSNIDSNALSSLSAEDINKIRSDDTKNKDARKLLNRLFTNWKDSSENKIEMYWWETT
jgi:hypothetical protein